MPIGIGDVGVPHVSGESQDVAFNVVAVLVPALETTGDKRVTKIMNANQAMSAAGAPAELSAQNLEGVMNILGARGAAIVEGKEVVTIMSQRIEIASPGITLQRLGGRRM